MWETLAGSAFLARAVSCQFGNLINASPLGEKGGNMLCFLTSSCEGTQARPRGSSASPLSRRFRNVTWQYVFRPCLLTLAETHHKYKLFRTQKDTFTLFSSVTLLRIAEWSRLEWNALKWNRGQLIRGSETLLKQMFRSLRANFLVKQTEFELC